MSNVTLAPLSANSVNETDVSFKAISGQIGIDKAQGIVECFVSGVGNKDSVGDIVLPGAFNASLKRRKPRVVWGHDWNQPIGKVLEIYEVPASDPRLPEKMKTAKIGGLFAKVQFNLNTERGREAFANVAFYDQEQEWSIGYKTINADFDAGRQANLLKEVELYEISPVLHGANQLTGTISVKNEERGVSKEMNEDEKGGLRNTQMGDPNDPKSILRTALSQALSRPIEILNMDENTVVFETSPGMVWQAGFHREGNRYMVGAPARVKPMTTYMPLEGGVQESLPQSAGEAERMDRSPMSGLKTEDTRPVLMRDGGEDNGEPNTQFGFTGEEAAMSWAMTLNCTGFHSYDGKFWPCEDRDTYLEALKAFDNNSNISSYNDYVSDAEKTAQGCSCDTETKGGGMAYIDEDEAEELVRKPMEELKGWDEDDEYKGHGKISRNVQRDPMALLLMAYNAMLPLKGATKERETLLGMIDMLEDFMVQDNEEEVEVVMGASKSVSGYVVNVKCSGDQKFDVMDSMRRVPVYAQDAPNGVDLFFSSRAKHDVVMERVAKGLARLSFDPVVSGRFEKEVDTNSGVK
jgi:HK97 family phage prohead protease